MLTLEKAFEALHDAAQRSGDALHEQAKELIAQIKRETEAQAEVMIGGLYERAAGVIVQDIDVIDIPTGCDAWIGERIETHWGRGIPNVPSDQRAAVVLPGKYRVITIILPRK